MLFPLPYNVAVPFLVMNLLHEVLHKRVFLHTTYVPFQERSGLMGSEKKGPSPRSKLGPQQKIYEVSVKGRFFPFSSFP